MLLLFIYREHLHVTFLWVIFGIHFAHPHSSLLPCARAGLSSPLLTEAGVDDTFSTLESAQFRIDYACSIRSHSRYFVSRTCASGRA